MNATESDTPPLPELQPEEPPPPAPTTPARAPRRGRPVLAVLAALLFVVLFGAVAWLWAQQQALIQTLTAQPAVAPDEMTALQHRLDALAQQMASLQQRPAAPVDLAPLEARIEALEHQQPPPAPAPQDLRPLEQKLASVAAEAQAAQGAQADLNGKLADLEQRLGATERQATDLAGKAAQAQRLGRALVALDAGEPLGDIAGAPPALARFANEKPPTEAQLRLSFPAAAAAAEQASRPSTVGKTFGQRMWLRARALITVRQGDRVLLGAPAAEVLGRAQARLDAGDLAGAVAALDALDGPAAQAMAAWRSQAQALLDARAALAKLARA